MTLKEWLLTKKKDRVVGGLSTTIRYTYIGDYVVTKTKDRRRDNTYSCTLHNGEIIKALNIMDMESTIWRLEARSKFGNNTTSRNKTWIVDAGPEYSEEFTSREAAHDYANRLRRNVDYSPVIVRGS